MHATKLNSILHYPTNVMLSRAQNQSKREDVGQPRDVVSSIAGKPPFDAMKDLESWIQKASAFDVAAQFTRIVDLFFGDVREYNVMRINRRESPRTFDRIRQFLEPSGFLCSQLGRLNEFTFELHDRTKRIDVENRENFRSKVTNPTPNVNANRQGAMQSRQRTKETRQLSASAYLAMRFCEAALQFADIEFDNVRVSNASHKRCEDECLTDILYITLCSDYLTLILPNSTSTGKPDNRQDLPFSNHNRYANAEPIRASNVNVDALTDAFVHAIFACWLPTTQADSNTTNRSPYALPSAISNSNFYQQRTQVHAQVTQTSAFTLLCLRMFVRQFHFWRNAALRRADTGMAFVADGRLVQALYEDVRRRLGSLCTTQFDALRKGACAAPHFDARFAQLIELLLSYCRPFKFDSVVIDAAKAKSVTSASHVPLSECALANSAVQPDEQWRVATFERFVDENCEFYVPLLASAVRVLRVRADCGLNVRQAVRTLRRLVTGLYAAPQTSRRPPASISYDAFFIALKRKLVQDVCSASWQPNLESTACGSPARSSPVGRLPLSPSGSPGWSGGSAWTSFGPNELNASRAELEVALRDCAALNLPVETDNNRALFSTRGRDAPRSTRDELLTALRIIVAFFDLPSDTVIEGDSLNASGNCSDSCSRSSESELLEPASTCLNRPARQRVCVPRNEPAQPATVNASGDEIVFNRFRRFRKVQSTVPKRDRLVSQSECAFLVHQLRTLSTRLNVALTDRFGDDLGQIVSDANTGSGSRLEFLSFMLRRTLSHFTKVTCVSNDTGRLLMDSAAELDSSALNKRVKVEFDVDLRFLADYRTWYCALLLIFGAVLYSSLCPASSWLQFLVYWLIRLLIVAIVARFLYNSLRPETST